jgi:hypothetical protein
MPRTVLNSGSRTGARRAQSANLHPARRQPTPVKTPGTHPQGQAPAPPSDHAPVLRYGNPSAHRISVSLGIRSQAVACRHPRERTRYRHNFACDHHGGAQSVSYDKTILVGNGHTSAPLRRDGSPDSPGRSPHDPPLVARAHGLAGLLPCRRPDGRLLAGQDGIHSLPPGSLADWSPNVMDPRRGNARQAADMGGVAATGARLATWPEGSLRTYGQCGPGACGGGQPPGSSFSRRA